MSCWHRHGYSCDWPAPPPEWYGGYGYRPPRYVDEFVGYREDELDVEEERPRHRRGRGHRRYRRYESAPPEEMTAASLQSRADALREELDRIEMDLKRLSAEPNTTPSET